MHTRKLLSVIKDSTDNTPITESIDGGSKEFNWITEEKEFQDLIQVTSDYVVHARGFTVGNDIWLDEYAVRGGHSMFWRKVLKDEYQCDYEELLPGDMLYWSVTGSSVFILQYPLYNNAPDETEQYLMEFLDEFGVTEEDRVVWNRNRHSGDPYKLYPDG